MNNYSAQNSITVKRLRNGDTFFISFDNNGVPLFQGVNPTDGVVTPSWGTGAGQVHPILTPKVVSARGNAVTLSAHQWSYNGVLLVFSGSTITVDTKTYTLATNDARFGIRDDGSLIIVGDLASKTNIAADTLSYSCVATVAGVEYNLTKSVDIQIQNVGASSFFGTVNADTEQLTEATTSTQVKTALYSGGTTVNDYFVKWWKDDTLWIDISSTGNNRTITVTRDNVDGTQLFIAEFYENYTDSTPVARAGIRITDTLDDFHVGHRYCNSDGTTTGTPNREVNTGSPVYLQAYVINVRTNTELSSISGDWKSDIMDKDSWTSLKTFTSTGTATNHITITTNETDVDGAEKDVEVVSEVEWQM